MLNKKQILSCSVKYYYRQLGDGGLNTRDGENVLFVRGKTRAYSLNYAAALLSPTIRLPSPPLSVAN